MSHVVDTVVGLSERLSMKARLRIRMVTSNVCLLLSDGFCMEKKYFN